MSQTVTFSVGTSSTTAAATGESRMDMSLDDLIKQNRDAPAPAQGTDNDKNNRARRRSDPKAQTRRVSERNKATAQQRSIGQTKAKRQADINARRQSQSPQKSNNNDQSNNNKRTGGNRRKSNNKPTQMEVEREVNRAKNRKSLQTPAQKQGDVAKPPTKKAVTAAVRAMKDAGFDPPKGMQVVISFQPKPAASNNNNNRQGGGQQQSGGNNNSNNRRQSNNNDSNSSNRGGGGRGRRNRK